MSEQSAAERRSSMGSQFDAWLPRLARLFGLLGLIAFGVVWIAGDRFEPILIAAFGSLYGLGEVGRASALLRGGPPEPPPLPDSTTGPPDKPPELR